MLFIIDHTKRECFALSFYYLAAILIIKICFLKDCRRQSFKKHILVFPLTSAMETLKSLS